MYICYAPHANKTCSRTGTSRDKTECAVCERHSVRKRHFCCLQMGPSIRGWGFSQMVREEKMTVCKQINTVRERDPLNFGGFEFAFGMRFFANRM